MQENMEQTLLSEDSKTEPAEVAEELQRQEEIVVHAEESIPVRYSAPMKERAIESVGRELLAVLLSYVLGFLYMEGIFKNTSDFARVLFCAAFTAVGLFYFRHRLRTKEHWIWLGCLWVCVLADLLGRNQVWADEFMLFVHGFAIYWILTLSGKLTEGKSSAFLPLDALNGAILIPFHRFFTFFRVRVFGWGIQELRYRKKVNLSGILYGCLAVIVSAFLLFGAGSLLGQADANFGLFLENILPKFGIGWEEEMTLTLILSLPVGSYLCGMICGTDRVTEESLNRKKNTILSFFAQIRHVSNAVWAVILCVFVLFYLVFLGFQSSYFFGAFRRLLPEDFTVAEYARQGFFELCKILAMNFALYWLACASSVRPAREDRTLRILGTLLLAESVLFAITAMSKLILYIDCFGFTPLRLQSFWLICVLLMGCVMSLISLWTGKKTIRIWIFYTGLSLTLLHLY